MEKRPESFNVINALYFVLFKINEELIHSYLNKIIFSSDSSKKILISTNLLIVPYCTDFKFSR